jgi:phenylacetate-CoA ligase
VFDHAGATEVGAWGIGTADGSGLIVNEDEFLAEMLRPGTDEQIEPGETGELVLTALGRDAWPVIRYRTGDIVQPIRRAVEGGRSQLLLQRGILGRCDDSLSIRGVNVFPSAIENLVREVAGGSEYRVTATRQHHMDELDLELEGESQTCQRLARRIREGIGIRVSVRPVAAGSLPRWEAKHRRFVDLRPAR